MQVELNSKEISAIISGLEHDYDHNAYSGSASFIIKMIEHKLKFNEVDYLEFFTDKLNFYINEFNHHCEIESSQQD